MAVKYLSDIQLPRDPTADLYSSTKQYVDTNVLQVRTSTTFTTGSLAANASTTGTVTLAPSYRLLTIETSRPARVRLYGTTTQRTADAARAVGTYPTGDHGLMFEFITTGSMLTATLSPPVDGFDAKSTPDGDIAYAVTNLDSGTGTVATTFDWIPTEGT